MSDLRPTLGEDRISLEIDESAFPRDTIYGAAYAFIDRCYARLDRADNGRLGITLRAKSAGSFDAEALAAELQNELLAQAFRHRLAEAGSELTASIVSGALGAPGAETSAEPSLDDLLIADGAAFDDPLGIALSWEEKHAGKADASAPTPAEGEQRT